MEYPPVVAVAVGGPGGGCGNGEQQREEENGGTGHHLYGLKNAQLFKRCTKNSGSLGVHDCC